jgi:hypothetical protein
VLCPAPVSTDPRQLQRASGHAFTGGKLLAVTAVVVAALLATVVSMAAPRPARSDQLIYCGVSISAYQWCGRNDIRHSYYRNTARIANASYGYFVCERLLWNDTGGVRYPGPTCGGTPHSYFYDRPPAGRYNEAEVTHDNYCCQRPIEGIATF